MTAISQLSGVPRSTIDEYFGAWACEPSYFANLANVMRGIDLTAHLQRQQEIRAARPGDRQAISQGYSTTDNGVAMIRIRGSMMKFVSSLTNGTSSVLTRRALRQAARDPDVAGILLVIDSPGGTVSGTMDLATDVRDTAKQKPTFAFVDDLTASASYWVASQATKIYANAPTALVGAIGTYMVLEDHSKRAEQLGIKVHVIKAGEHKGVGVPGTAVTDDQVAHMQSIVNSANDQFLFGVRSGRRMGTRQLNTVADGRIFAAKEAASMGLIDGVRSLDEVVLELGRKS